MLGLPKSTEINKQLSKKAVYTKFQMNTLAKEKMDADISKMTIVNEITPGKINVQIGEKVTSIFVLCVSLKRKDFDDKNITKLSKLIPQNILFVLEYENEMKLAVYYTKLIQTNWKLKEQCFIEIRGLSLDTVWENMVVDVGDLTIRQGISLDNQIKIDEQKQKLEKEIVKLEKKARSERQPKKKYELASKVKELTKELNILKMEEN